MTAVSETQRIAEQLRLALQGDSWAGVCVKAVLDGISAEQAAARPLAQAHTIWELALHIEVYLTAALEPVAGKPLPHIYKTAEDWRTPPDTSPPAWQQTVAQLLRSGNVLADAIERLDPARLTHTVPNRDYDLYYLLHGVVQHTLYHLGQIVMVKKVLEA